MYGRVGVAWNPQDGQYAHGVSFNLIGVPLGGRLEEGDYLEPTIKLNIVKPSAEDNTKPYFHVVLTPSMFSSRGSFLGAFANNFSSQLRIELFQAYLEAGNILLPDLKLWVGQRFYRGSDVHIADYFFFNQLNGQGFGAKYKGLDVAVLLQTSLLLSQYLVSVQNPDTGITTTAQRQRTVFVAQYVMPVKEKHSLHLLAEFHLLPEARARIGGTPVAKRGNGEVLGAKFRLDLGNGSFNETALRVGKGVANGAFAASPTWSTYGATNEDGTYGGLLDFDALGFEFVDHFLYNVNPRVTLNAFLILQTSSGASGRSDDTAANAAIGLRAFFYMHDQFHLIAEATSQAANRGAPEGEETPATPHVWKLTLMPTLVPTGEHSAWARPHLRFIYTVARYNSAAVAAARAGSPLSSPYLNTFGAREWGHYLGTRAEWWF